MSQPRFFGTDGIRGKFGHAPLDETTVRQLGAALGQDLAENGEAAKVVLGGDTRESTPILCSWLGAELQARGVAVQYLGTVTTPGVTFTVLTGGASAGIAVSASHNPHPDNGIKLIDSTGFKWTPQAELELEEHMSRVSVAGGTVDLDVDEAAVGAYCESLKASLQTRRLDGLHLVVDVGFGAATPFAQALFSDLGARVTVLHDQPDGRNINRQAGSTHPEALAAKVVELGADLGVAFDGDADRAVIVDERGEVRDGDAILYLWGLDLLAQDRLPGTAVVATSMSNLGLEAAFRRSDVELVRCGVGDREVVATMRERGLVLGGEQSGHIVNLDLSTTGDGLLTALQVADLRQRSGRAISEMLSGFQRFPQLLKNVPVRHKPALESIPAVVSAVKETEDRLGDEGRLVLRYSGTEPLVRIMLEGADSELIETLAATLARVLDDELG